MIEEIEPGFKKYSEFESFPVVSHCSLCGASAGEWCKDYCFNVNDPFKKRGIGTSYITNKRSFATLTEIGFFHSIDNDTPALSTDEVKKYYWNGFLHRYFKPAVEFGDGLVVYYRHGKRHREDGPSLVNPIDESYEWFLDDKKFTTPESFCEKLGMSKEETMLFVLKHGHLF